MLRKKHHRKYTLKELYDYLLSRKDLKSRHFLEREMQQNPFLEDALEGYTDVPEENARKAVDELNARIHYSEKTGQGSYIINIAASITLLIVSMLSYFAVEEIRLTNTQNQFSLQQKVPEQTNKEIKPDPPSIKYFEQEDEVTTSTTGPQPQTMEEQNIEVESDIFLEESRDILSIEEDFYFDAPVMEYHALMEDIETEQELHNNGALAPVMSKQEAIADESTMQPEILTLKETHTQRPGILQRIMRKQKMNESNRSYKALTAEEKEIWQKYLDENAILPDSTGISKVEIIVRFELDSEGKPINFETIESHAELYTQHARQLIKDGPLWVFRSSDSHYTHEKVELTIVFRKQE